MLYDDFITQLLNMEDSLVKVDNIETDLTEKVKYVHISTKPVPEFCEKCGSRMHSNFFCAYLSVYADAALLYELLKRAS